jgi:hypothetical protein
MYENFWLETFKGSKQLEALGVDGKVNVKLSYA